MALLELRESGLYCGAGDFFVDPWGPVERAIITHAHGDHARAGSQSYLAALPGQGLLRARAGDAVIHGVPYGAPVELGGVTVSFHPAGHILGSAQVRIEHRGEVWVVSGDYKLRADPTCAPFEPLRCNTFVTESTFGLPVFQWPDEPVVMADIHAWWTSNRQAGKTSVVFVHPVGKAQRLLALLDGSIGPVRTHAAVERINEIYREQGIVLPATSEGPAEIGDLVIAPVWTRGTPWVRQFGSVSTALVSGWMRIRGTRRRQSVDRGFVLSDHADWPGLLAAIDQTGAADVWVTHGHRAPLVRWLQEHGRSAQSVDARFGETEA